MMPMGDLTVFFLAEFLGLCPDYLKSQTEYPSNSVSKNVGNLQCVVPSMENEHRGFGSHQGDQVVPSFAELQHSSFPLVLPEESASGPGTSMPFGSVGGNKPYYFPSDFPWFGQGELECSSNASGHSTAAVFDNPRVVMRLSSTGPILRSSILSLLHTPSNRNSDLLVELPLQSVLDGLLSQSAGDVQSPRASSRRAVNRLGGRARGAVKPDVYNCRVCWRPFTRRPDCTRHERFTCVRKVFDCIVCKKKLCRKDSLMRHLSRNDGINTCSKVLEAAGISNEAVGSRRARRRDLGTEEEIDAVLKRY